MSPPLVVGGHAGAVAIGDLNRDATPDIVAARLDAGTLSVYLGGGAGQFRRCCLGVAVGNDPGTIAVGDLNDDGKADIVTGNWGSGDVSVVLSR